MDEAIADTGPIRHLHEINSTDALAVFERLLIPDLVDQELRASGIEPDRLGVHGLAVSVTAVQ